MTRRKPAKLTAAPVAARAQSLLETGRKVCVIGAGLGGLATAIRLRAKGVATTLIEARPAPGGRLWAREENGFTFSSGPLALPDPDELAALWTLTGDDPAAAIKLLPLAQLLRCHWPDGASFDLLRDPAEQARELARFAPGDLAGFDDWQRYGQAVLDELGPISGLAPLADPLAAARALPQLAKLQGWRSLHGAISRQIGNERLREALGVSALLRGANPFTASALLAGECRREASAGLVWPEGGMGRLGTALLQRFEQLGGTVRLHDPVRHIHTLGNRASEVETQSGWREPFDAVVSNADMVHTYRDLLADNPRGPEFARHLTRQHFAPALFAVHFALAGTWPGIPHRMVLMPGRYKGLLDDIYQHGVLPQDMVIFLGHPSVTDPTLAPPGKSVFQALVPVAHQGKLPIDWEVVGPMLEKRVLAEIGRRLIPDIDDRIAMKFHITPRDAALDFNAYAGNAFALEATPLQSGPMRLADRDRRLINLYRVGAATSPGGGVSAVLAGARRCTETLLENLT